MALKAATAYELQWLSTVLLGDLTINRGVHHMTVTFHTRKAHQSSALTRRKTIEASIRLITVAQWPHAAAHVYYDISKLAAALQLEKTGGAT